ncbi:MAG: FMN-binding protein [Clostridia bacterium]|nr:FMN-binding protein [Clostridia bacterium]
MKLKLKNFTPAIVLGTICLIVAALLATINHFTAPEIAENERLARTESLRAVFGGDKSGADFGDPMKGLPDFGEDSYVSEVYEEKHGMGYAVTLVIPKGFEAEIDLTVGVGMDGKVKGVYITKYEDTIGKDKMPDAVNNFVGKDSVDDVALVTGATYSSTAVRKAVSDALAAVKLILAAKADAIPTARLTALDAGDAAEQSDPKVILPLTEEEIFNHAKEMLVGAGDFELLTKKSGVALEGESIDKNWVPYKIAVYKEKSGKGYAVYGETFNPWGFGAIESNFVFAVDNDFTVVGFDLLSWSLSPSWQEGDGKTEGVHIYLNTPAVKRLEESFVGINRMNFSTKADLVTKATVTSVRIEDAVFAALEYVDTEYEKEVKTYQAIGASVIVIGIAALGVAIYFQRRRRK